MRLYIIGKMRGVPYYNFPAFDAAAAECRLLGYEVMSPADMDRQVGFDAMKCKPDTDWNEIPKGFDFKGCVMRDLDAVVTCDGIVRLTDWEESDGARAENAVALWMGKLIYDVEYNPPPCLHGDAFAIGPSVLEMGTPTVTMRQFATGATRDAEGDKPDYDGFLSPLVIEAYGAYMHKHRKQADGTLRDSDNWQKGIPRDVYRKSAWRHFLAFWKNARNGNDKQATQDATALLFNVMGWIHETLKKEIGV